MKLVNTQSVHPVAGMLFLTDLDVHRMDMIAKIIDPNGNSPEHLLYGLFTSLFSMTEKELIATYERIVKHHPLANVIYETATTKGISLADASHFHLTGELPECVGES